MTVGRPSVSSRFPESVVAAFRCVMSTDMKSAPHRLPGRGAPPWPLESDHAAQGFTTFHGMEGFFRLVERNDAGDDAIEIELPLGVPL